MSVHKDDCPICWVNDNGWNCANCGGPLEKIRVGFEDAVTDDGKERSLTRRDIAGNVRPLLHPLRRILQMGLLQAQKRRHHPSPHSDPHRSMGARQRNQRIPMVYQQRRILRGLPESLLLSDNAGRMRRGTFNGSHAPLRRRERRPDAARPGAGRLSRKKEPRPGKAAINRNPGIRNRPKLAATRKCGNRPEHPNPRRSPLNRHPSSQSPRNQPLKPRPPRRRTATTAGRQPQDAGKSEGRSAPQTRESTSAS